MASKVRLEQRQRQREEMSYDGTPEKAHPNTRRRTKPPTPQRSSQSPTEERQWQAEMEVQESFWSVRERTVIAKMEGYLGRSQEMRVACRELEHLMGPDDSEVDLMYIWMQAIRRGSSMFEFSSTSGSEHLVASRNQRVKCQEQNVALQKRLQKNARKDVDKGDFCWTEAAARLARRMLKYLEDSESTKVRVRELEDQVLYPNESVSNIVHIVRRLKNEKRQNLFQIFMQGQEEIFVASKARWDAQLRGLVELTRLCRKGEK